MKVIIAPLEIEHLERTCAIENQSYSSPWSQELIAAEFTKSISFRKGLFVDNILAAYCFSYLVLDEMHLLNIAVSPEYRQQGLGRHLLSCVLSEAWQLGCKRVLLEVRESNKTAKKLYESVGFLCFGSRKNYYQDNNEDAELYELYLDESFLL